jgi:hypothetical protein
LLLKKKELEEKNKIQDNLNKKNKLPKLLLRDLNKKLMREELPIKLKCKLKKKGII